MISFENTVDFVPHGRQVFSHHPGAASRDIQHALPGSSNEVFNVEGNVPGPPPIPDTPGSKPQNKQSGGSEFYELSPETGEELYCKENLVVLSSGFQTKKCYTNWETVEEVVRCRFYTSPDRPCVIPALLHSTRDITGEPIDTICARNSSSIRIHCDSGDEYKVALQFGVNKMCASKYGLILERQVLKKDKSFPAIFALLHPLDDISRVIFKQGQNRLDDMKDNFQQIVFSDVKSSIVITYNSQTDRHSVWRVRRTAPDEIDTTSRPDTGASTPVVTMNTSGNIQMVPSVSLTPSVLKGMSQSPSLASTPGPSSRCSRTTSALNTPGLATPNTRPCSPVSRVNSPQSTGRLLRSGVSPSFSFKVSARLGLNNSSCLNFSNDEKVGDTSPLPLGISLCFDHIWTEQGNTTISTGAKEPVVGKARKVFMSEDPVGQSYFCFLMPNNQLKVVKFKYANDSEATMLFGSAERMPALDAVPIPDLKMILVLETTGCLCLYSGTLRVGKTILSQNVNTVLSQEISALALDSEPRVGANSFSKVDSTFTSTPILRRKQHQTNEPMKLPFNIEGIDKTSSKMDLEKANMKSNVPKFPVLCDANPGWSMDTNPVSFSPVHTKKQLIPVSLRDPVGRQVTIVYKSGEMRRVTLPKVSTSLVEKALNFLIDLMPRELGLQLHAAWYTKRHAPGPSLAPAAEWDMFCKCILEKCGYQTENLDLTSSPELGPGGGCGSGSGGSCGPGPKRSRTETGTDGDWQYLLHSPQHTFSGHCISKILGLDHVVKESSEYRMGENNKPGEIDSTCQLFNYLPSCFLALHLLYEELKLDTSKYCELPLLVNLLSRLSTDLQLYEYQLHYWTDFPDSCFVQNSQSNSQIKQEYLTKLNNSNILPTKPPCIFTHLLNISQRKSVQPFPILTSLNESIKLAVTCSAVLSADPGRHLELQHFMKPVSQPGRPITPPRILLVGENKAHTVAEIIANVPAWSKVRLDNLPMSLSLPVLSAISSCQLNPRPNWDKAVLETIGRADLAENINIINSRTQAEKSIEEAPDGLEGLESDIAKLRWPKDLRRLEARRILQSYKPVTISLDQGPEVSDHDFVEEQEYYLKRVCERTMALPVGRGMAALRSTSPLPTEVLSVPQLCLTGKAPPRGTKVELSHIDFPQNMDHWPCFHNGVAAGLRLNADHDSPDIDSRWISFNKPCNSETTAETEHAGFLLALGLNGHLAKLSKFDAFEYLNKGSEPISIGLMIGVAASHLGTMDLHVTKKLATQLEALLPHTATELPLSHNTQVASLLGIGLVYANTGHRHMVEVCLRELGKLPGPELENAVDRESYSLTAGLSLGLITMGRGESLVVGSLADLQLPNLLHNYMLGGPRPNINNNLQERPQSYQIKEGDSINTDITSPGATLALGIMYWNTNNENVASWMEAPDTMFLLDFVRPDFLMLRTLAKGLIMWDRIVPSVEWVEGQVPRNIVDHCLVRPPDDPPPGQENLDYETINQAYCNIVSGAAFVLALKFAGTWNMAAFTALEHYIKKFIAISKRSISELTGKAVIEQTICTLVLSQAIVMAGSGDLSVLRVCRFLRSRVHTSTIVTYGSHMAIHMAVGFLFLGGGSYGLARTPTAIAALIISCFPKFPTHSNDNRYHLQAFRHLYVLAVQPRLLNIRETETGKIVACNLSIQYEDTPHYVGPKLRVVSPVLLPDLDSLSSISIEDKLFWRTTMTRDSSWNTLKTILDLGGNFYVQKCGLANNKGLLWSLSEDDFKLLEQHGFNPRSWQQRILQDTQKSRVSQQKVNCRNLDEYSPDLGTQLQSLISSCVFKEQHQLIPFMHTFLSIPFNLSSHQSGFISQYLRSILLLKESDSLKSFFLEPETVVSVGQSASLEIDKTCVPVVRSCLREYVQGVRPRLMEQSDRQLLSSLLTLNKLPSPCQNTKDMGMVGRQTADLPANPLKLIDQLKNSPSPATLFRLMKNTT